MQQKRRRTHGQGQQCGDCGGGEGCTRGVNVNVENTIKNKKLKKRACHIP